MAIETLKKIGVYGVHNTTANKWYIGSSKNVQMRIDKHIDSVKNRTGQFKGVSEGDDFVFKILKIVGNDKSLELWENYFIGLYNSIENGYNKILASRKPSISINGYCPSETEIIIIDDDGLVDLLKLNSKDELTEIKKRLPHFKISKNNHRYDQQTVINFLLAESETNTYLQQSEAEVSKWFMSK